MTHPPIPAEFNETQQKIIDATIRCIQQWGMKKTNINDIAREAGVTRPTVYSYFPNRQEVIRSALLHAGYKFAVRAMAHMNRFEDTRDRVVESLLFALEELPKEPYLGLITETEFAAQVHEEALHDEEGQALYLGLFREMFRFDPRSDRELIEITEFTVRLLLSLLILKGPVERNRKEQRAFLQRRLLPGIGLSG